jgi:Mg2+-importing ATPase
MVIAYLLLIEAGKRWFYRSYRPPVPAVARRTRHRVHRRAARFTTSHPIRSHEPRR